MQAREKVHEFGHFQDLFPALYFKKIINYGLFANEKIIKISFHDL